jgi:tetraacyldisaccharide 4'-kinase
MDDGFQHRWVKPSLSILVTQSLKPFWRNYLLPVGTLREAKTESNRADILVVSGSNGKQNEKSNFEGETFQSHTVVGELVQFSGEKMDVSDIKDVLIFSGIANEQRFENSISQSLNVRMHLKFADHHNYTLKDLSFLRKLDSFGAAVNAVITTEKDAARLANSPILNELKDVRMFYLPIEIDFGGLTSEFNKRILGHGKHA